MKNFYTTSDFYLMLKLGLFRGGEVEKWGDISVLNNNNILFLKKNIEEYKNQLFAKRQLTNGLYLLDFYLHQRYTNNQSDYIVIISVCKTTLCNKDKIYVLKLSNSQTVENTINIIKNGDLPRKRRSLFRRKSNKRTFDSSPLNSIPRKH